jgi:hypothetical protein
VRTAAAPRRMGSRSASFPGRIRELRRPPDEKRPPTPLNALHLAASKPPTRRSVHIRAASFTRLKPPLNKKEQQMPRVHASSPPRTTPMPTPALENKQTFDTATQRYLTYYKIPAKTTPKILITAQNTPWAGPTSTPSPSRAMRRR